MAHKKSKDLEPIVSSLDGKIEYEYQDLFSNTDEDFSVNRVHEGYVEPVFEEIVTEEDEEPFVIDERTLPDPFVLLGRDKEDGLDTDYPYFITKLEEELYGVDEYEVDEDFYDED